jgi:hypothetical protein
VKARHRIAWWEWLGWGMVCVLLALWQTSAWQGRWGSHYLGSGELEGWLWRYWWLKLLLTEVWTTPGVGLDLAIWVSLVAGAYPETGNVLDLQLMSWPLEALLGTPLYYNAKCALVLALNGVAGYHLGREVLKSRSAGVVCGLVLLLSPYALHEIANGRVRQAILFPLALYALHLVRLWREPGAVQAVYTGVLAGLCSAVYLYYGMGVALFTVLFIILAVLGRSGSRLRIAHFGAGLLTLLVAFLTALPFAWAYVDHFFSGHGLFELSWQRDFPPLSQLVSPDVQVILKQHDQLLNSMQRFRSDSLPWQYPFMPRFSRGLPWVFSIMALLAIPLACWRGGSCRQGDSALPRARDLLPWLGGALFFYMLTLGPYLMSGAECRYVALESGGVATPYVWFFKYLPAFSRLFSPIRMSGMLVVSVGVLAGAAFLLLVARLSMPRFLRVASIMLIAMLVVHGMKLSRAVPLPETQILIPEFYYYLAKEPFCAIAELPFRTGDYIQNYQTVHAKRLLGGWSGVTTPPGFPEGEVTRLARAFIGLPENSFFRYLESLNVHPEAPSEFSTRDLEWIIHKYGLRLLIVHERGYYRYSSLGGRERYEMVLKELSKHFGPPVEFYTELTFERLGSNHAPWEVGPFEYEMVVFRISP